MECKNRGIGYVFSIFSMVGNEFEESGFAPLAITIHIDILPRINPWDSLDYNNITTPYRSGYSMIFQDLATIGVPHLGWYFLAAGQMPVPISLS